jgi:adenine-specific DNA-methyltransferase
MKKQKLELTWIGKENRPRLEPRILLEDPEKSYHAAHRVSDNDIFDNRLIFGDNLLALKALEQEFAGKIKCIYIDPPYNTGSAFQHYDDGVEHSLWLSMMWNRLALLHSLLTDDGSLWMSVDDNEGHYLKVIADEAFGRGNFVANVVWQKKYAPANDATWLSDSHDHILVFAKNKSVWRPHKLPRSDKSNAAYKNPDNDPRGPWKAGDYTCNKSAEERPNLYYPIKQPKSGEDVFPSRTRVWAYGEEQAFKRFLTTVEEDGAVPQTVWLWGDVGHNQDGRKEQLVFAPNDPFSTPKPERLLSTILTIASKEGDIVLDSFAGSGTTGAVAHKMGRRWIMVELGDHCHTHVIPRLKKVVDGDDPGGVTEACNWKGGGGFRYYKLAPSLLEQDQFGNWVINKKFNAEMLAEAMCKLEGFTYAPSEEIYWQHGRSTETDFIYVTTQTLSREQLQKLSDEVGPHRSLLVCCGAFRVKNLDALPNLTLKKIPRAVMDKCEWGKDDYSLEIKALSPPPNPEPEPVTPSKPGPRQQRKARARKTATLFDDQDV